MRVISVLAIIIAVLLTACTAPSPTAAPAKPVATTATAAAPAAAPPTAAAPATNAPAAATKLAAAPTTAPVAKIKRGGTLISANLGEANSWDPALNSGSGPSESPAMEALLSWETVDQKTGKHEAKPWLAESYSIVDPKTITFKIRQGVKFHDGSDLTAEVVAWHMNRMRTWEKSAAKGILIAVDSITATDPTTVKFSLKYPYATIFVNLTGAAGGTGSTGAMVYSKAYFDKNGEEAVNQKAVGTGPFIMEEWRRDDKTLYKRFDGYWRKGEDGQPLPYLDRQENRILRDTAVGLLELKAGTIHVVRQVATQDIPGVQSNPDLRLATMPWAGTRMSAGFLPDKKPWGANLKLRQASQYAVDRASMAKTLGAGVEPAYYGMWVPSFPGWDEKILKYEFNIDKGKQYMKDAGFPDGADIELSYGLQNMGKIPEILQSMWAKVGIRTKLTPLDNTAFNAAARAGTPESVLNAPLGSPDPDLFSRAYACDGSANWWHYCTKEMDACLEQGRQAYDFNVRHEIYKKCLTIVQEDSYTYGLVLVPPNVAHRKEVAGLRVYQHLVDLRAVWIDK